MEKIKAVLRKWGWVGSHPSPHETRIADLERQIAEVKKRWPAHSPPAALMHQLDELEADLENEKKNQ